MLEWSPIRRPDKGSRANALVAQVWDFIRVVGQFAIKRRLRCVPSSSCCIGGGHTHIHWLSNFLNIQRCRGSVFVITGVEVSGGGCFNDCSQASLQRLFQCPRVVSAVLQCSPCSSCGSKKESHSRHSPNPVHGLAAMRALRCAGAAMSRALLYPILDWPALSVACTMLSSVKPGKCLSRDRCPASS